MKKKLGIVFGGRSGEHEVSLVSASAVVKAVDREKYDVVEIGITLEGKWYVGEGCLAKFKKSDLSGLRECFISMDTEKASLVVDDGSVLKLDIFFPVLHGPFGEDGTIQGLFEMMNAAYVGCGVLASSTAMDKLQFKAIMEAAGVRVSPYVGLNRKAWEEKSDEILKDVKEKIGYPCFVKPANMGSSVGVSKVKDESGLRDAINLAAKFDRRVLVEKAVNAREIECSVIGNDEVRTGELGEIFVGGEFYDFHDKYVNGVSTTQTPADFEGGVSDEIKGVAMKAYKLLDCAGFSRVDFLVDKKTGEVYVNEINTIPGFTEISMFPKMMMATGMKFEELVDELIDLGFERFEDKQKNQVKFDSGSDWFRE
ncbi:MAG: D-alanine--D-alanine ligase family protein [Candidatus Peregrinibacteria bacterium]